MRTIDYSSAFTKDYKREVRGGYRSALKAVLPQVVEVLVNDQQLGPRYRDHNLSGEWSGYRECHVKPDLLLIYQKIGNDLLQLVRLGSHSELFG